MEISRLFVLVKLMEEERESREMVGEMCLGCAGHKALPRAGRD